MDQQCRELSKAAAVIYSDGCGGVFGHRSRERFGGILDHRDAATILYRQEPSCAIIEVASQDNSDNAWTVSYRRRSKERVDSRSGPIFFRPVHEPNTSGLDHQMLVGKRDIDVSRNDCVTITWMLGRQRPRPAQYLWKRV